MHVELAPAGGVPVERREAAAAHAAEREMRAEAAPFGREPGGHHTGLDALRQQGERRLGLELDHDDARLASRGEGVHGAQRDAETAGAGERRLDRLHQRWHLPRRDVAEEAQRHVEALGPDPAHGVAVRLRPQLLRERGQRLPRGLRRLHGEEGAHGRAEPACGRAERFAHVRPRAQRGATRSSPSSARRTQSSATCDVTRRCRSRSNGNRNS